MVSGGMPGLTSIFSKWSLFPKALGAARMVTMVMIDMSFIMYCLRSDWEICDDSFRKQIKASASKLSRTKWKETDES